LLVGGFIPYQQLKSADAMLEIKTWLTVSRLPAEGVRGRGEAA
jgi:hypothetical protein